MTLPTLPPTCARFSALVQTAFDKWIPNGVANLHEMKAGKSGAAVFRLDVRDGGCGDLEPGNYVLKLNPPSIWEDQEDEDLTHARAYERSPVFSQDHLPELRERCRTEDGLAILYEIAGKSLINYSTTDLPACPGFLEIVPQVIEETLTAWSNKALRDDARPYEILEELLGYRLDPNTQLRRFAAEHFDNRRIRLISGEAIPDPLWFHEFARDADWPATPVLNGLLHNDLHGGNLLIRQPVRRDDYHLIDFGLSADERPIGFDQSYLEVFLLLRNLGQQDPREMISLLRPILDPTTQSFRPAGAAMWLFECVATIRRAVDTWIERHHSRRRDELAQQFALCRVAAGMNWANKPLEVDEGDVGRNQRLQALLYSGLAARDYVARFHPDHLDRFLESQMSAADHASRTTSKTRDRAIWTQFWNVADRFSVKDGNRYVLIAEGLGDDERLQSLGKLPWSVVIDLDPYSDESGLHRHATPVLESQRKVHSFRRAGPNGDLELSRALLVRGTAWMMANGWSLKNEQPLEFNRWRYERLNDIRTLFGRIAELLSPEELVVVVMPGTSLDANLPLERVARTVTAIEEATRGTARTILLGSARLPGVDTGYQQVPLEVSEALDYLVDDLGTSVAVHLAEVPGRDGPCVLPVETLRALEENLVVLHSRILDEAVSPSVDAPEDAFWRGNPPTWFDLHVGVDIERDLQPDVERRIRDILAQPKTRTVILYHNPGAGATTLARRVAWDLRGEIPTVILHTYSPDMGDRLASLYTRAELPVLLVAESDVLPEARREDLYRELSSRNARVVLLYLRRSFASSGREGHLFLAGSISSDEEADRFKRKYLQLTEEPHRRTELGRITSDERLRAYRTPFFYGLVTYERDFQGTESFVENHLDRVWGKAADVLRYLAMITIYTNSGLHKSILGRLIDRKLSRVTDLTPTDLLGERPAGLVVNREGRLRLLHQIVSEEVFDRLVEARNRGAWRQELKKIAVDFIEDLARVVDQDSEVVIDLLRQLFIERSGPGVDDAEDRKEFAPLIQDVDLIDSTLGHQILLALTECFAGEAHFWNHLGRHHIYRMKRDFGRAEACLLKAVSLAPDDYIHHHTLGLVRRSQVRQVVRGSDSRCLPQLLKDIEPYFDGAAEAFGRTRKIKPDNMYGYITHVQMITHVLSRMRELANTDSIAELPENHMLWVQEQLSVANDLLQSADQLYGTLDRQDRYLTTCLGDIQSLYGNLDDAIQLWELQLERTPDSPPSRRAIAYAFLERTIARTRESKPGKQRARWTRLGQAELRRIRDLMASNLRSGRRLADDYRMWFESTRLLPQFDIDEALGELRIWTRELDSWRAYYYKYILHFLLWAWDRTDSVIEIEEALDNSGRLFFGRRRYSHLWLAEHPEWCPLVATEELGEFDQEKKFWTRTEPLRRVNGSIREIHGPQSGWIDLEGALKAFFVPHDFTHDDVNTRVNFFLGFSPTELKAWSVERGHVEGGTLRRPPERVKMTTSVRATMEAGEREALVKRIHLDRVLEFVETVVTARAAIGAEVEVAALRDRVEAAFGLDHLFELKGKENLVAYLRSTGRFRLTHDGDRTLIQPGTAEPMQEQHLTDSRRQEGYVVRLGETRTHGFISVPGQSKDLYFKLANVADDDRPGIKEGSYVAFTRVDSDRGPVAYAVKTVERDGPVEPPASEPDLERPAEENPRPRGWVVVLNRHKRDGFISVPGETKGLYFKLAYVYGSDVSGMQRGSYVEFSRVEGDDGPVAYAIARVEPQALIRDVQRIVITTLETAAEAGRLPMPLGNLEDAIEECMGDLERIKRAVKVSSTRRLLQSPDRVRIEGEPGSYVVDLLEDVPFGRVPRSPSPVAPSKQVPLRGQARSSQKGPSRQRIVDLSIELVGRRLSAGKSTLLSAVMYELRKVAGGTNADILKSFGVGSVDDMFAAIPGIEVVGEGINRSARLTNGFTKSESASEEESAALPDNFTREIVAQWIRDYARDHPGTLLSKAIFHLVKATGHGAQETYRLFDVSNATKLVEQIKGVTTHGSGAGRTLELSAEAPLSASAGWGFPRANDGQSGPTSAAGPTTADPTDAALDPEAIAEWIRGFVRDNPGCTLKHMMSRLVDAKRHKSREILGIFGVKNATGLIERIDGVMTVGDGDERSVEPTPRTSSSALTKSSPHEPKESDPADKPDFKS